MQVQIHLVKLAHKIQFQCNKELSLWQFLAWACMPTQLGCCVLCGMYSHGICGTTQKGVSIDWTGTLDCGDFVEVHSSKLVR